VPNLALIALGDSHHSQGGMKFATQISPLLNSLIFILYFGALPHELVTVSDGDYRRRYKILNIYYTTIKISN
jgi:hypothetical protein